MQTVLSLFLFVSYCVVFSTSIKQFRCDYKYVSNAGGWLKFHEIPSNWNEARTRCNMEGTTLASPTTPTLAAVMSSIIMKNTFDRAVYTGIHSTFSRGDYTSIEGVPLSKIPHTWAPDEPDNFENNERCIIMLPNKTIADESCTNTYPYLCFKPKSDLVITDCGTSDPAYKLNTRTGKCYKFHTVAQTWSRAYMTCMAEGGHLLVLNSDTEAATFKELFAKYPSSFLIGAASSDVAFIGARDWDEHGDWRTIQGQTLSAAGYKKFAPGQPDNSTSGEFCMAAYRSSLLLNVKCDDLAAFVCERKTGSSCDDDDDEEDNS